MAERIDMHMRETDAFSWYMERDALLRSTVVAVVRLERAPDWDLLVERVDRATRLVPSFRQKVVETPLRLATPRWVTDPDFDLSFHLRRQLAPPPGSFDTVLDVARRAAMAGFDTARPLWEFTLVDGLDGGEAAVVMKVHHALTDGVGGMQLAMLLFDVDRDPGELGELPPVPDGEAIDTYGIVRSAIGHDVQQVIEFASRHATSAMPALVHAALHPGETAAHVLRTVGSIAKMVAPVRDTLSSVMTERHLASQLHVLDVPLADLRAATKVAGSTLNDGFLAGILGGLRHYHELHEAPVDALRVTLPISIRKESDPVGGNRITLMRFKVPVAIVDARERMAAVHQLVQQWREEPAAEHTNAIAGVLNLLPRTAIGDMLKHVDFLASNVPGVPFPIYLAGQRVLRYYPFGPPTGAAVNVTLLSYDDTCCIGINADTAAIPDTEEFVRCLRVGFDEVLTVAKPRPGRRRRPSAAPAAAR
jgi:WS/DGAT/MGAT family acyltransferase